MVGPLALTLGDPAGVGPEIVAKAWRALKDHGPVFVAIGDGDMLAAQGVPISRVDSLAEGDRSFADSLPILDLPLASTVDVGSPSSAHAPAIVRWIETAVALALSGEASGIVTAPIAKAPLYEAGFKFPGHTEFLADLTAHAPLAGERGPVMMLASGDLRTVLVTIHEPYARAPSLLTVPRIVHTAVVTAEALRRLQEIDRARLSITRFEQKPEPIASGISAAPGMASGRVALDSEMAVKMSRNTDPVVLLRPDTSTADVAGFAVACGILTATGGRTAPAALVARQLGKPCIVGCDALVFDMVGRPGWVRPRSGKAIGFR